MNTKFEEVEITKEQIEQIERAFRVAFGCEPRLRYEEQYIDVVEIDGLVALTVGKGPVEHESITGKHVREEERWFVEGIKYYPATRHEPEDVDYFPIAEHPSLCEALIAAFSAVVRHQVEAYFECEAMAEMAKEWEAEKAEKVT
jgi:hypothetical protein